MGIDLTKADYVSCMFFAGGVEGDVMGCIYRVRGEERLTMTTRIRTYVDNKAFDSEDRKSWFEGHAPMDQEDAVIEQTRAMVDGLTKTFDMDQVSIEVIKGSPDRAVEWLTKQPWANMRVDDSGRTVPRGNN